MGAAAAVGSVTVGGSSEAPTSGAAAEGAAEAAAAASATGRGSSEGAPLVLAAPSSSGLRTRRRVKKLKYVWVEKRRPDEEDDADLVGPMPLARVGDQHVGGDWGGALRPGASATDDPLMTPDVTPDGHRLPLIAALRPGEGDAIAQY